MRALHLAGHSRRTLTTYTRGAALGQARDRVAAAALQAFGQHGYAGTTMRELAKQLQVQPASLYSHFLSKDELLAAALAPLLDELDRVLPSEGDTGGPGDDAESVQHWLADYHQILLTHPVAARVAGADLAVGEHPQLGGRLREQNQRARARLLSCGVPDDQAAAAILGALWWPLLCLPTPVTDTGATSALNVALHALRAATPKARATHTS